MQPPPLDLAPPRLIGPLSGSLTSGTKVAFFYLPAEGTDGAIFDFCADSACTQVTSQRVNASSSPPGNPVSVGFADAFAPGHFFWRVRTTLGGVVRSEPSATWEAFIPHRDVGIANTFGTRFDVDRDGFCDFVLDGRVLRGGPTGFVGSIPLPPGPDDASATTYAAAGDLNGDGFSDLLRLDANNQVALMGLWTPTPLYGGVNGVRAGTPIPQGVTEGAIYDVGPAADVNHDGFADVLLKTRFTLATYYGGANAVSAGSTPAADTSQSFFAFDSDIDADGFADVVSHSNGLAQIVVSSGSPTGFAALTHVIGLLDSEAPQVGTLLMLDANADGFADVAVTGRDHALRLFAGTAFGLSAGPFQVLPSEQSLVAVASADFNGDGWADLIVNHGGTLAVHNGRSTGIDEAETPLIMPPDATVNLARGAIGDVNGDGFDDLTATVFAVDPITNRSVVTGAVLFLGGPGGLGAGIPVVIS
jgi:hypothetical protein